MGNKSSIQRTDGKNTILILFFLSKFEFKFSTCCRWCQVVGVTCLKMKKISKKQQSFVCFSLTSQRKSLSWYKMFEYRLNRLKICIFSYHVLCIKERIVDCDKLDIVSLQTSTTNQPSNSSKSTRKNTVKHFKYTLRPCANI